MRPAVGPVGRRPSPGTSFLTPRRRRECRFLVIHGAYPVVGVVIVGVLPADPLARRHPDAFVDCVDLASVRFGDPAEVVLVFVRLEVAVVSSLDPPSTTCSTSGTPARQTDRRVSSMKAPLLVGGGDDREDRTHRPVVSEYRYITAVLRGHESGRELDVEAAVEVTARVPRVAKTGWSPLTDSDASAPPETAASDPAVDRPPAPAEARPPPGQTALRAPQSMQ